MKKALRVRLNGSGINPFHTMGLLYNPFPQIADSEHDVACLLLQKLGGDPIPDAEYIRKTLAGHFTEEFIQGCVDRYKPGEMVEYIAIWEE